MFASLRSVSSSREAGSVKVNADTGEFNAKIEQAERQWRESVGAMSKDALRLELAQDRLRRSLANHGAESNQAKRATLQLKEAEEQATRSANQMDASHDRARRSVFGLRTSMLGLRASVAGTVAGLVGGGGLVYGLMRAKDVASNLAEQTDKSRRVFGPWSADVERFAKNALGLANDQALELTSTLGALLRPIGIIGDESARLSQDLIKRGVDLSSFYNRDVKDAIEAVRAGIVGEAEPLRTFGVRLSEARVQALALQQTGKTTAKQLTDEEKVRARIAIIFKDSAIAADNYRQTIKGAANQEKETSANLRDIQAIIGQALLPSYRSLLSEVNEYLGSQENQERLQQRVNDAVETGETVVRRLVGTYRAAKDALDPFVDAVGGFENAVGLAFAVGLTTKVTKFAGSFGLIAASSAVTRTKVELDAVAMGAALDAATRPRNIVVTTTTTTGGAGRAGLLGSLLGGPATIAATAIATSYLWNAGKRNAEKAKWNALTPEQQRDALAQASITAAELESRFGWKLKPLQVTPSKGALAGRPDEGTRGPNAPYTPKTGGSASSTTVPGSPTDLDFQVKLTRAFESPGTRDELGLLRGRVSYVGGQIAKLEAEKTLTEKEKQRLLRLYGERDRRQDEIDRIEAAATEKQKERERLRAERRRREAEEAAARRRRDAEIISRVLSPGPYATIGRPNEFAAGGTSPGSLTTKGGESAGMTPEEFARRMQEFLAKFDELHRRYGGTAVGANVTVHQSFPAPTPDRHMEARYARFAMESAFDG